MQHQGETAVLGPATLLPTTNPTTTAGTETVPSTSSSKKKLSKEEIHNYVNDPRFNGIFQLPADPSRGRPKALQISYADFGFHRNEDASENDANGEEHVLLFFGPLLSSRFHQIPKDELAKRYKIRIISIERPGIGKTDNVPAEQRIEVSRDATAALLTHLNIAHVSIACHSGGTVFGLDFLFHNPHFLSPSHPSITFGAPWVHPSHSGMRLWSLASVLPSSLVSQTGKLASFGNALAPSIGASAAVSSSVVQFWNQPKVLSGRDGTDVEFEERLRDGLGDHVFAGSVAGLGLECQVLLRNGVEKDGWADWKDFDELAPRLVEAVRSVGIENLAVDVFFAEKDIMIGDGETAGPKWFETCWRDVEGIDFRSEVVKGSDHDRVWDLRWDAMEEVFKRWRTEEV